MDENNPFFLFFFYIFPKFDLQTNYFINAGAQSIGVCYGMLGNNLPSASDVVALYKSNSIYRMRIYDPNQAALNALRGSSIELILGIPNSDLQSLTDPNNAASWVQRNIVSFWPSVRFRYCHEFVS